MTELKRLRLELVSHDSYLVLVGDRFEEGGRYVQKEISRAESWEWTALEWFGVYERLKRDWHRRHGE